MKNLGMTFFLAIVFLCSATLAQAQSTKCQSATKVSMETKKASCNPTKKCNATKTAKAATDAKPTLTALGIDAKQKSDKACSPGCAILTCKKEATMTKASNGFKVMTVGQEQATQKKACNPSKTCQPASCGKKVKVTEKSSATKNAKKTLAVKN